MTDLEMTKLCAKSMGYEEYPPQEWFSMEDRKFFHSNGIHGLPWVFNPIHDDAQAMALVKKCSLDVYGSDLVAGNWKWHASWHFVNDDLPEQIIGHGATPNRAIVECVAKMQQAKQESRK